MEKMEKNNKEQQSSNTELGNEIKNVNKLDTVSEESVNNSNVKEV